MKYFKKKLYKPLYKKVIKKQVFNTYRRLEVYLIDSTFLINVDLFNLISSASKTYFSKHWDRISYYTYCQYHHLLNTSIGRYINTIHKVLLDVVLIKSYRLLLYLVLIVLFSGLFPVALDYLKISVFRTEADIDLPFNLILGSLSSLSGILIALVLISVELYSSQIGPNFYKFVVKQKSIIFLVSLFVCSMIFNLSAKIVTDYSIEGMSNNLLAMLAWLLFASFIVIMFPLIFSFFRSIRLHNIIEQEIYEIDINLVNLSSLNNNYLSGGKFTEYWNYLPLKTLEFLTIKNVNSNILVPKSILTDLNQRLINIFEILPLDLDGEHTIDYVAKGDGFYTRRRTSIFKPLITITNAIFESKKSISNSLFTSIVFEHCRSLGALMKRNATGYSMMELIESLQGVYKKAILLNDDDKLSILQVNVFEFATTLLENNIQQYSLHDIKNFYPEMYPYEEKEEDSIIWARVKRYIDNLYSDMMRFAAQQDKIHCYNSICSSMGTLLSMIAHSEKINWGLKGVLTWHLQASSFGSADIIKSFKGEHRKLYSVNEPFCGAWLSTGRSSGLSQPC